MQALNIVCISHNAPPMDDAEALCTSRLLSALVQTGATVHLITSTSPPTLAPDVEKEIFDERIRVTRVPHDPNGLAYFFRYHTLGARWVGPAVSTTREILRQYENPILMTRAMVVVSNFAGYYCRDLAKAWVAHFSDPHPLDVPQQEANWYSRFEKLFYSRWTRRIVRNADLITVTCPNAIRYIEEKIRCSFRRKAMILTHIALPKLNKGSFKLERSQGEFIVAHIGNLMAERRPDLLLQGAILAMERHPEIRFLQYGNVAPEVLEMCRNSGAFQRLDIRNKGNISPREATDLREQVDANVIVDMDLGLPYSPFIPSKYPHSVCSGKPLLMISADDSQMAAYTKQYGGGVYVPYSNPQKVCEAICELYDRWKEKREPEITTEYINEFAPERVIYPFLERIRQLSR